MMRIGFVIAAVIWIGEASRTQASRVRIANDKKIEKQDMQKELQRKSGSGLPKPVSTALRETNRASAGFIWDMLKMKGNSYTDTFCSRSKDDCATVDGYPGKFTHSELTFDKVVEELQTVPALEESGEIRRLGDLGYLIFNDLVWTKDWKTFPIGADIEDHRKHRQTADLLMGSNSPAWNHAMIRALVADFFTARKTLDGADITRFVTKLFHKVLLDMDLNDIEVSDFEKYKADSMKSSVLPRWLSKRTYSPNINTVRKNRELWLEKYEHAIENDSRQIMPKLKGRDRRFLADLLLTTMTSAGGISVPSVMQICLAVIYGGKNSPLSAEDRKLTEKNVMPLVLETVRRFPVVVGFPWWSPDQSKRHVLNLAMALRDPRAWESASEFKLRPLSEYHKRAGSGTKIGVAWAQQGKGPQQELTPDSRGCPGQELSIVIVTEFLQALRPMQSEWVVTDMPKGGIKITEGPSKASEFTLTRGADPSNPPRVHDEEGNPEPRTDEEAAMDAARLAGTGMVIKHHRERFRCPEECLECCQSTKRWDPFHGQDDSTFKCIMRAEDVANFKIVGRKCGEAHIRNSDARMGKATCHFSATEKERELHEDLEKCAYVPVVQTFAEFVGFDIGGHCSASPIGGSFLVGGFEVIGSAIKAMYFSVSDPLTGGVCGMKIPELMAGGMLDKLCEASGLDKDKCGDLEKNGLCQMLQNDWDNGRLDAVALAMWGAAIAPPQVQADFPKPIGQRLMKKFKIPGWGKRVVAYESPIHDKQIDLAGGGFQCMMKKLAEFDVEDDFYDPHRNQYVNRWEAGAGQLSLLSPFDPTDVLTAYFDRIGVYQTPLHFVVPEGDLQLDVTLEKLVFRAIGAHRVEPIVNGETISLNPIGVNGLPTAALAGSPGLLDALPAEMQKKAKFIVRLEGLFDKMPVRKGMQGWGGNAFFNLEGKLLALQYRGETIVAGQDPRRWEILKFIFRSSLVSTITAFDHLVSTHICASNSLAMATVETLPENHGLRIILTPHTWGTLNINMKAATNLFAKKMLVHRASPYADDAFEDHDGSDGKLWKMIPLLRYTKFMDNYDRYAKFKERDTNSIVESPDIPFFEDGKLLYNVFNEYLTSAIHVIYGEDEGTCDTALLADDRAQNFVAHFFQSNADTPEFWPQEFQEAKSSCESLAHFLTELVFLVTGWHRHVGTVADFFRDTRFVATSWKEGEHSARPRHSMLMMLLAATTNAIYPKINESLTEIYSRDYIFRDVFTKLQEDMNTLQAEVEKRNIERAKLGLLEFHQMEPQYVEWGVQV